MESPRSERSQTRFSTPVSDLDDHRRQPSSLPRAEANAAHTRRPTFLSVSGERPDLLDLINEEQRQKLATANQNNEQAVTDGDSMSVVGSVRDFQALTGRRPSAAHQTPRHKGGRRTQNPEGPRSRSSSQSSRSTSPPNSVDAFADPRRRERANTLESKVASELDLCLNRTVSNGTHRRLTVFSDGSAGRPEIQDDISKCTSVGSVEEDVCFPQPEEPTKTSPIDFEELEEFVAELARAKALRPDFQWRKQSFMDPNRRGKVFNGLGQGASLTDIPNLDSSETKETAVGRVSSEDTSGIDEKEEAVRQTKELEAEHNRFSFFSSELDSTVHAAELGDLVLPGESFRDLFELDPEGGVWWLDVLNPSEDEVNAISRAFSIHPLTSEDIKTQETREKVELFKQYYFVCFRSFFQMDKKSEEYMEPLNVYIVVFREGVLSFTFSSSPHAANVRKRIGRLRDYVSLSSDWICYALIDDIVDNFGPVIHDIERETDQIEDSVFVARTDDFRILLQQIGECRKKVMSLMRLLGGKADVIKGFAKRCNEQYSITPRGEIGLYLGDIQDHVVTMMSNLGHFEKMLSRSHSNYLAQLSVDSIAQGNRANEVLSKITLIATILVPLNFICGLFGMNVPVPGEKQDTLGPFFGIIGFILIVVSISLFFAKRYRYI
ncbi:cora-domain-containing protein [Xylona heveae TC161]|uniref:Cora-domain-containing protein n=1 Tax=Xylona heveae (strain CBS 132557 / TC161) TaxID=1328760 RepID=A0A165FSI7_XYLHT|nr:cora-domain-containing protein [Xylona heveae TC161]KZF21322.1 cora-domain-containing protein [Xylona heveae TC161]